MQRFLEILVYICCTLELFDQPISRDVTIDIYLRKAGPTVVRVQETAFAASGLVLYRHTAAQTKVTDVV